MLKYILFNSYNTNGVSNLTNLYKKVFLCPLPMPSSCSPDSIPGVAYMVATTIMLIILII